MTDLRRRSQPLRTTGAERADGGPPATPDDLSIQHVNTSHQRTDEDRHRFADAVRALRTGTGSLNLSERTLMVLGGILAPLGLLLVLLGWVGASRTPHVFEQVPYLISGGLFGLGLVFLGAFFYFAHWLTELVKEHRSHSTALLAAITELRTEIAQNQAAVAGAVAATAVPGEAVALVATSRGSMAHRADCVVVAGKHDLRPVGPDEGLAPCKLCDPYEEQPSVN
jgi:multisubunit Na+/H+ antiporter MnhG subunit